MAYSFSGGVKHKTENKINTVTAVPFAEPKQVAIPLSGATPAVKVGDFVDIGACLGVSTNEECPVAHASVSGAVTAIENRGGDTFVVIKNDGRYTTLSTLSGVSKPLGELTAEELIARIRNAGIVDAANGKALAATLSGATGKVKRVVINCTESQPWESSMYRLAFEQTEAVIKGTKLLIYILGARKADIALEEEKKELMEKIESHITDKALIGIKDTTSKHPISINERLIYTLYNKRVPLGGKDYDVGYAVFTPETAAAVYRALSTGMPMIHKRVTVAGDGINNPQNLIVPIGTSVSDIAEFCGGTKKRFKRVLRGGAFMGEIATEDAVVGKTDSSLLFFSSKKKERTGCIRCGQCIDVCPVGLSPVLLAAYSEKGLYEECLKIGADYCVECGCCTYTCPSGIPITSLIKKSKKKGEPEDEQA